MAHSVLNFVIQIKIETIFEKKLKQYSLQKRVCKHKHSYESQVTETFKSNRLFCHNFGFLFQFLVLYFVCYHFEFAVKYHIVTLQRLR